MPRPALEAATPSGHPLCIFSKVAASVWALDSNEDAQDANIEMIAIDMMSFDIILELP